MRSTDKPKCYLDECDLSSRGRIGLCDKHYRKKLKYGDPRVVICDTGNPPSHLRHGRSKPKDGKKDRTYNSWTSMHWRCNSDSLCVVKKYKDKGITVCSRWKVFENFLEDMGERPLNTSLDRIDGSKGYSKENCRWADPFTQGRNRTQVYLNFKMAFDVMWMSLEGNRNKEIAKSTGISYSRIYSIVSGRSWKDASQAAKTIFEEGNG